MENQILVSIIIPLYNKKQYFERCFNSIVKQTYKNIECIIVDDCSTDSSLDLAQALIENYTGHIDFLLIRHRENSGVSASRNTGINKANGEYLFFLDSDDEITEKCISLFVSLAVKYSEVDVIIGNAIEIKSDDRKFVHFSDEKLPEIVDGNLEIKKHCFDHIPSTMWNKLVRKKFIQNHNLYLKKHIIHEDTYWIFFMLKYITKIAFTKEITYVYYSVPDSYTTNSNLFLSILSHLTLAEDMLSNLDIDTLERDLGQVRWMLDLSKERILSDEKYSSLMPKCQMLLAKTPKEKYFMSLVLRGLKKQFRQMIKRVIRRISSEN